ncbi:hypothetical protein DBV15_08153 [Temnothorax longispinosus]|uniref:Uncharacterized protein n=1 Tax=Temnothorax longispinosus TaxID=300112 RepID=A0A4S2L1Z4_9HYME|nr:hypothetical protein DBV15_08153 [Temnothorax longispinosus]
MKRFMTAESVMRSSRKSRIAREERRRRRGRMTGKRRRSVSKRRAEREWMRRIKFFLSRSDSYGYGNMTYDFNTSLLTGDAIWPPRAKLSLSKLTEAETEASSLVRSRATRTTVHLMYRPPFI